ncbi:bifunctional oligoribonuclease/PAP phosphatase NrnA, partial [bacterium]|nr:bifunctional oligoribonuclease/PAP phosphatase NrnA [bacterium]
MAIPKDILTNIDAARSLLVTCHVNPDGDAIGALLGLSGLLRSMGKHVVAVCEDPVPRRYHFLPGWRQVMTVEDAAENGPYDTIVVLDAGDLDRIGQVQTLISNGTTLVNIDHHVSNPRFGDAA